MRISVSPGGISFSQMLDLRTQQPKKFTYHLAYGTDLERIAVNFDNPILKDKSVRQALLYAIDRKAISDELFGGLQPVAHGILSDQNAFYNKDMMIYKYDAAKAKDLLAKAGWKPGRDGICVNGQGDRLSLELGVDCGQPDSGADRPSHPEPDERGLRRDQEQLRAAAGIGTGEMARKRKLKALMMSSIDFSPSVSPRIALGSDAIPKAENNGVGNNFSAYASPDMDKALGELEMSLDPNAARKTWERCSRSLRKTCRCSALLLPAGLCCRA